MIGISRLYTGQAEASDRLRYGQGTRPPARGPGRKPVVVWNCTRRCNLHCLHCYSRSDSRAAPRELSTAEGRRLIDDLAAFKVPVLLFSGGEPLLRQDLTALILHAGFRGLRVVISTNGTLITENAARHLQSLGVSYVGVSLDGTEKTHDRFRGKSGAFQATLAGIRACRKAGLKVGLRCTITRLNHKDIPALFDLVEQEGIPRVCFYHLVYSGRGAALKQHALTHRQSRRAVDLIIDRTARLHRTGSPAEVLTVDNHCDGPYLYLRMLREKHPRAAEVLALLKRNGGSSSGRGIACVGWDGTVYPDQFWRNHPLGNVRETPFSRIWSDRSNAFLAQIRQAPKHLKGRCRTCRFLAICGGNFRARAEAATGDLWACDPACYLTDREIRQGKPSPHARRHTA